MENVRSGEIEDFVRSEIGLGKSMPLSAATRLFEDLGLTGNEASDFMGDFLSAFPSIPATSIFTSNS